MIPIETLAGRFNSEALLWQCTNPPMEVAERVALACACAIIGQQQNLEEAKSDKRLDSFNQLLRFEVNGLCWALRMFEEQGYGYVSKMTDGHFETSFVPIEFNLEWALAKANQHREFLKTLSPSYAEQGALRKPKKEVTS